MKVRGWAAGSAVESRTRSLNVTDAAGEVWLGNGRGLSSVVGVGVCAGVTDADAASGGVPFAGAVEAVWVGETAAGVGEAPAMPPTPGDGLDGDIGAVGTAPATPNKRHTAKMARRPRRLHRRVASATPGPATAVSLARTPRSLPPPSAAIVRERAQARNPTRLSCSAEGSASPDCAASAGGAASPGEVPAAGGSSIGSADGRWVSPGREPAI